MQYDNSVFDLRLYIISELNVEEKPYKRHEESIF